MSVSTTDIFLGYGSIVGLALESTYNTPATISQWLKVISLKIREEYPQTPRPHLHAGTGRVANNYYTESHDVTVSLEVEMGYDAIGLLLRSAMGPAPSSTGAGPYAHPFLLGNTLPSLTIRGYTGTATGALTARYVEAAGCVCNSMTMSVQAGGVARLKLELFGKSITRGNQATPTVTETTPVLYHQVGTVGWNSGTYDGNSIELSVNNGLARRRNLGALTTAYPHPSSLRDISVKLTRDHVDGDLLAALTAVTESDLTFAAAGTGNNGLTLTLHSARVVSPAEVGAAEGGFGAIPEVIEFKPRNVPGGTDYGLAVTVTNDNASYLT